MDDTIFNDLIGLTPEAMAKNPGLDRDRLLDFLELRRRLVSSGYLSDEGYSLLPPFANARPSEENRDRRAINHNGEMVYKKR
jgi:hypothetical protein